MTEPPREDPAGWAARLSRALRSEGVPSTPHESLTAARAVGWLDAEDPLDLYFGARAIFVHDPAHLPAFDRCFRALWGLSGGEPEAEGVGAGQPAGDAPEPARRRRERVGRLPGSPPAATPDRAPTREGAGVAIGAAYSPAESLTRRSLGSLSDAEVREVDRALARVVVRLSERRSRRWRPGGRRGPMDWRRSLRAAVRHDAELVRLSRRRRRLDRPRVVLLCDVSGSMARYSRFLLRLLLAALRGRGVEAFAFGTRLTRLTPLPGGREADAALVEVEERVRDFSGGTRIGACLEEFLHRHGRSLLGRRSVVVILSDGLDRGDPERMTRAMRGIRRRARRIVWLNPLLESPEYRPEARGMRAALPFVDDFAPGHSLEALRDLPRRLRL